MALTADARNRIGIAVTDFDVGSDIADAIDGLTAAHNPVTLGAVGSAPSANAASLATQVLTLQPADATHPGVVTISAQTFGGAKTFATVAANNIKGGTATLLLGQSSISVTDANATTLSHIVASFAGVDGTATSITRIEKGAGSFIIHTNATATANCDIMWVRVD